MKADVVIGLQFGSEAKGKICQLLAEKNNYDAAVRVQSIQAGHTVYYEGKQYKMRTIPCAWVDRSSYLIMGPGAFIDRDLLLSEIKMIEDAGQHDIRERLILDYRVFEIGKEDQEAEKELFGKIGSTCEGAGASLIRKIWRTSDTRVDLNFCQDNGIQVMDTVQFMNGLNEVLVEGCQGTLLSIHTSPYYPFVTSREATVSGVLSECGIAPFDIREVYGVMRTYPIRVGGNSGDTGGNEITWKEVNERSGLSIKPERTTVTNRERRIFEFSRKDIGHAIMVNKPSKICLTFVDYLNAEDEDIDNFEALSDKSKDTIKHFENVMGQRIDMLSTGAAPESTIWR